MEINVGDKVRVHDRGGALPTWVGSEGFIKELVGSGCYAAAKVELTKATAKHYSEGQLVRIGLENLEVVPFGFNDIRKGDKIRRTLTREDGTLTIVEGVAERLYSTYEWLTENGHALSFESDDERTDATLELVERPEPKHWAYTKPVGSLALYKVADKEVVTAYRKLRDAEWQMNLISFGQIHTKSTEALAHDLRNLSEDKLEWIK
jgi:hypothetical protein